MKRKWLAALCLLLAAVLLTACDAQQQQTSETFAVVTQYLGPAVTEAPRSANVADSGSDDALTGNDDSIFANNPYTLDTDDDAYAQMALSEEDYQDDGIYEEDDTIVYGEPSANATVYPYAGSSPIPLDPIDAPTATPRAPITFTYVPYAVTSLGVTFEAPAGWMPDESIDNVYTLSEPAQQIKDGQLGIINIYAVPVNSNYTEANLKTEILQRLSDIGSTNYTEWNPSLTATRYLMGGKGVYANYSGTLANGIKVGGRIHATAIQGTLYCVQITYPLNFKDDYLNVFSKIRETIKRIQ